MQTERPRKAEHKTRSARCRQLGNAGKFLKLLVRQAQRGGRNLLLEMFRRRGSWNRQHERRAFQKPREGDLLGTGAVYAGDLIEDFAGGPSASQGEPGNKSYSVALTIIQDVIPFTVGKTVAILDGDDRDDAARALDVLLGDIGQGHEANLSFVLELRESSHGFLEWDDRIRNMKLVDVDAFEPQPFQAALNGFTKVSRGGIVNPLVWTRPLPTALRGNDNAVRVRMQGFGNDLFADVWSIGIRSVNEIDTQLHGPTKNGERRLAIFWRAPNALSGKAHGAETEAMDGKLTTE